MFWRFGFANALLAMYPKSDLPDVLAAANICQTYGHVRVLTDVSISVFAGSVTVLMGRSGSGKSTLLRAVSLVESPQSGTVELGQQLLFPVPTDNSVMLAPWPDITVVFQQLFLWPHMTLRQNIRLPAKLRNKDTGRLEQLCRALGIDMLLERFPNQVSVGQRQRAAIARALLLQPRYLLLDEITSAQDIEQVANLLSLLIELVKQGMGLLVVTHHIGFAKQLLARSKVGQVVFIDHGNVVEAGNMQCMENPVSPGFKAFLAKIQTVA